MRAIAVYLCGDELPTVLFPYYDEESKQRCSLEAEGYPSNQPRWMDKEVKDVDLAGSLER